MSVETVTCAGEAPRPWYKKINPVWWLGNDEEPEPPYWHKPGSPAWWRLVTWYLRNPMMNYARYCFGFGWPYLAALIVAFGWIWWLVPAYIFLAVGGVVDRPHAVTGPAPAMTNLWTDDDPTHFGAKWAVSWLWLAPLPWWSYEGKYVIAYAGWQPWGFCGVKLNLKFSSIQFW